MVVALCVVVCLGVLAEHEAVDDRTLSLGVLVITRHLDIGPCLFAVFEPLVARGVTVREFYGFAAVPALMLVLSFALHVLVEVESLGVFGMSVLKHYRISFGHSPACLSAGSGIGYVFTLRDEVGGNRMVSSKIAVARDVTHLHGMYPYLHVVVKPAAVDVDGHF